MNSGFFKIQVDAKTLAESFGQLAQEAEQAVKDGVKLASAMAYAHANELARERLHSRLNMFLNALTYHQITDGVWSIELDESATWIDDGTGARDMKPDLLRKNAKTSKTGAKYKIIPFEHSKNPQDQTPKQKDLTAQIKNELKNRKIPFKKIELNSDGSPRIGKLHSFNIDSNKPSARAKTPALQGVNIYQRKGLNGNVRKDIVTFRVVSSKQTDMWFHPGNKPVNVFDDTYKWVLNEFEGKILPDILSSFDNLQKT